MTTGADIIARRLADGGCRRAFGLPGGEVLALLEALRGAGVGFHLAKHENGAGFMADGAWAADCAGRGAAAPGILLATIGPGVANGVTAIANAHQERMPLIVLTGCTDTAEAATYTHQVFDHAALLAPIVKGSFRVAAGAIGVTVDKALALAMEGQPGPVHLDVPIAVAEGAADETGLPSLASAAPLAPAPGALLDDARALLGNARAPLVIAGIDAVNEGAGEAITGFCRARGIPLITTYKAKGLMDESDPLALGGHGLSPKSDGILKPLLAQADLIMLLGYDPIEMRKGWRRPWPDATPVIEAAPVLRQHGMHGPVRASFACGVAPLLDALADAPAGAVWPGGEPARVRAALGDAFGTDAPWGPARIFHTLREVLPAETVATVDSGAHRILLNQIWRCPAPRTMLQSAALCTMGCALPLATGHALVRPDVPTVVFVGDAGLEMIAGELATLRDLKVPVLVVVLVDESLALIELKQRGMQQPSHGVDFPGSDFPALAAAFGGVGCWIDDDVTLREQASMAWSRETFTLLACRIGRRAYDGAF